MPYFPLQLARCALLINDLEEKMVEPSSPMYAPTARDALERLLPLLRFCREHDVPTLFALIGPQDTDWKAQHRIEVAPGAVTDPALSRLADRLGRGPNDFVFEKPPVGNLWPMSGLWRNTPADAYLRERGRDTVLVAGTTLQFGCNTTVREASNLGYYVAALRDCCAVRPMPDAGWGPVSEEEIERVFFTAWSKAYARVLTADEALAELRAQVR
jgi:nicotinamidase-related amidase